MFYWELSSQSLNMKHNTIGTINNRYYINDEDVIDSCYVVSNNESLAPMLY